MKGAQGKLQMKGKKRVPDKSSVRASSVGDAGNASIRGVILDDNVGLGWDLDNYATAKRGGMYHGYSRDQAEKIAASIVYEAGSKTRS